MKVLLLAADLPQSVTVLFVTPCRFCEHWQTQKVLNTTDSCGARSSGRNAQSWRRSSLLALLPEQLRPVLLGVFFLDLWGSGAVACKY